MGRIVRTVMVVGGTALLVAMPREDYARLAAQTGEAMTRAYHLVDKHVVRPIRVAWTTPDEREITSVPAPRPAIRPSLVGEDARRDLAAARIPEVGSSKTVETARMAEPAAVSAPVEPAVYQNGEAVAPQRSHLRDSVAADVVRVADANVGSGVAVPPGVDVTKPPASDGVAAVRAVEVPPATTLPADAAASDTPPEPVRPASPPAAGAEATAAVDASTGGTAGTAAKGAANEDDSDDHAAAAPPPPSEKPEVPADKKPPVAAKLLFGAAKSGAPLAARAIGFYSRGCLAGGKALPVDGPAWQAMRLSRNRNWGHPKLISLLETFASEVQKEDGWPGLLVGDISQPRGGPMLTGHASHQIGLDADIWFTPMPGRRLSRRERESLAATSMILGPTKIDPTAFTDGHVKVVKRAAKYPQVERILVHPAIKKALCDAAGKDRAWLGKVRPYFGHYYHFHVRIGCPDESGACRGQKPPTGEDGCGKELTDWFARLTRKPSPRPKVVKPTPPKPPITLADLPDQCKLVLEAGDGPLVQDEAELVKSSVERSKEIIDISGQPREEALARKQR